GVQGQPQLLHVVLALEAGRGLADLLHGGHKQANQNRNDGDDDEQLNQRERRSAARGGDDGHGSLREFGTAKRIVEDCCLSPPDAYFLLPFNSTWKSKLLLPGRTSRNRALCELYSSGKSGTRCLVSTPGLPVGSWTCLSVSRKARSLTTFLPGAGPLAAGMWYLPSLMVAPACGPLVPG